MSIGKSKLVLGTGNNLVLKVFGHPYEKVAVAAYSHKQVLIFVGIFLCIKKSLSADYKIVGWGLAPDVKNYSSCAFCIRFQL